ncbi:MAG: PAS domain-containing sensor histidine kinase, partial [Desulfobacterales bacterium]|nr:PAS domain-containing sensor histidine kinase [Desulfobacterales bacterium]
MKARPSIEDLVGLGHTKLGFFKEVQIKMGELKKSNSELDRERRHVQAILDGITDIVAVVSPQHRIRSVNHSFFDVYPGAEPIGR